MSPASPLPGVALSVLDAERLAEVLALAGEGPAAVDRLVERLDEPSWPVRRVVVSQLARLGDAAVLPLLATLRDRRDLEARLAAAVDALVACSGSPEAELVRASEQADPSLLCDLIQILGRRRSTGAEALFAGWTLHEDDNVSVCAIEALGRLGGDAGLEALIEAAGSGRFFRVLPALDALSRSADPRALPPLERLLADPLCGPEAARGIGRRGELDGLAPLAGLLAARTDAMVRVAATALVEIVQRQSERFGTTDAMLAALRQLTSPSLAARHLARALAGAEASERAAICRLLGWLGEPLAAATLIERLRDEPAVARAAAQALAELGGEAAREVVLALRDGSSDQRALLLPSVPSRPEVAEGVSACLSDPEPEVRAAACGVLARAGAVSAVPALFAALDDDDPIVSRAAVNAIHALGHAHTEPLAIAAARSPSLRVRRAGLRILGYFGWRSGLATLLEALASGDERLRDTAIQGLALVDDPRALDALLQTAEGPLPQARASAMRALGRVHSSPAVLARLQAGMSDPDPWVRYYACQALGAQGAVGATDALVERLTDEAGQVRIAVIDALARMPGERAMAALVQASRSPDPDLRRAALLGLGSARPAQALPILLEAASEASIETRLIALSALASFEGASVEQALAVAASDESETVRAAAIGALAGRAGLQATATLLSLLEREDQREAALAALCTPALGRIPALLAALETAETRLAGLLVTALARMRRDDALAALGVVLSMDHLPARRAAALAFAALGPQSARPLLERVAERDPDLEIRQLALHALERR
jgi:HEAT repeat protein